MLRSDACSCITFLSASVMSCTKVGRDEMAKYAMYAFDPDFHKKISMGDIVVAGRNFAGGSSRDQVMMRGEV